MRYLLTLFSFLLVGSSFAQEKFSTCYVSGDSCYKVTYASGTVLSSDCEGKHIVFSRPNRSPRRLPRLGTNPQFGTLKNYTTTSEVYDHLRGAYEDNEKGNARELDKLWQAMGYTGFNDPAYNVSKLTAVYYDAGVTGMLGAGGNSYVYASISPGQDLQLKGYKVASLNGCDVTIMEICGNAFYPGGESQLGSQVVSKSACKIDFPAGVSTSTHTITSFIQDGQCFVRACEKATSDDGSKATVINNLSHNQQFGSMASLKTSEEVYNRLISLYSENKKGNAAELDRLMRSIGYSGLKDPNFTAGKISIVRYEGGIAATMGSGEHQYMFSEISTAEYDVLRGFEIKALNDNCDLTFVDICGNALYCPKPLNCQTFECGCE